MNAVKITSMTDAIATIEGQLIVFGGTDLVGETFTKDTNFWTDHAPEHPPVLFEHGLDETIGREVFGRVTTKTLNDEGIWVEAQIDRGKKYAAQILTLIEQGRLGWSSGSVGHLVERVRGIIKSWPIFEASLTPIPAEPRTLGIRLSGKSATISLPADLEDADKTAESLNAQIDRVLSEWEIARGRVKAMLALNGEVKYGAAMTGARRDRLGKHPPVLRELAADIEALLDEVTPPQKAASVALFADYLANQARELGVQV